MARAVAAAVGVQVVSGAGCGRGLGGGDGGGGTSSTIGSSLDSQKRLQLMTSDYPLPPLILIQFARARASGGRNEGTEREGMKTQKDSERARVGDKERKK